MITMTKAAKKVDIEKIARISRGPGGYYISPEKLDYINERGRCYECRAVAHRVAKRMGYTHCMGSGVYGPSITKKGESRIQKLQSRSRPWGD